MECNNRQRQTYGSYSLTPSTPTTMAQKEKTMFQKLEDLNLLDSENGTKYLQVCGNSNVISCDKKGNYGEVKFGIPADVPLELLQGKDLRFMLLIIDGERYDKLED